MSDCYNDPSEMEECPYSSFDDFDEAIQDYEEKYESDRQFKRKYKFPKKNTQVDLSKFKAK